MRYYKTSIPLLLPALLTAGCESVAPEPDAGPPPVVVEGWIDEHESPVVMVTRAVDLREDSPSFDGFVEKWCRVSVFDGERQYVLTGRKNSDYMPPFIYTSSRLRGEPGHVYRLTVEFEDRTLESVSELRSGASIASLEPELSADSDTLYSIRARFSGIDPESFYKVYARSERSDSRYYGSFLGTFAGRDYTDDGITVTRGVRSVFDADEFSHYFAAGDMVYVKLCTIGASAYEFWKSYDAGVSLSTNAFFTKMENCPSNVSGGLGCWSANGTSVSFVRIPRGRE